MGAVRDKIFSFKEDEWNFERSSGYAGERNSITNEWVHEREYCRRKRLKEEYEEKYKFLADFRSECLPFGQYPEYVIVEFLEKHFKEQSEQEHNHG